MSVSLNMLFFLNLCFLCAAIICMLPFLFVEFMSEKWEIKDALYVNKTGKMSYCIWSDTKMYFSLHLK